MAILAQRATGPTSCWLPSSAPAHIDLRYGSTRYAYGIRTSVPRHATACESASKWDPTPNMHQIIDLGSGFGRRSGARSAPIASLLNENYRSRSGHCGRFGVGSRAMLPILLLTRQAGTQTSAKLSPTPDCWLINSLRPSRSEHRRDAGDGESSRSHGPWRDLQTNR